MKIAERELILLTSNEGFTSSPESGSIDINTIFFNNKGYMKTDYAKPVLVDLNEQSGYGGGTECGNGSGASGDCVVGNLAGRYCFNGNGAKIVT